MPCSLNRSMAAIVLAAYGSEFAYTDGDVTAAWLILLLTGAVLILNMYAAASRFASPTNGLGAVTALLFSYSVMVVPAIISVALNTDPASLATRIVTICV